MLAELTQKITFLVIQLALTSSRIKVFEPQLADSMDHVFHVLWITKYLLYSLFKPSLYFRVLSCSSMDNIFTFSPRLIEDAIVFCALILKHGHYIYPFWQGSPFWQILHFIQEIIRMRFFTIFKCICVNSNNSSLPLPFPSQL